MTVYEVKPCASTGGNSTNSTDNSVRTECVITEEDIQEASRCYDYYEPVFEEGMNGDEKAVIMKEKIEEKDVIKQ